jgi:hypothetical protein
MSALEGGDGEQSRALTLCGRHGGGMKKWLVNQPYCTISLKFDHACFHNTLPFCWSATPLHVWGTWPPQCLHPHPMHCGIDGHEVVLPSRFVFSLCCCCHGLLEHWQQGMRNIPALDATSTVCSGWNIGNNACVTFRCMAAALDATSTVCSACVCVKGISSSVPLSCAGQPAVVPDLALIEQQP